MPSSTATPERGGPRSVITERTVECVSPVEALWEVLGDTEYMNHLAGLTAPKEITPVAGADGARYRVRTRVFGLAMEWEELPFECVYRKRFRSRQRQERGLLRSIETSYSLERDEGRGITRIAVTIEQVPRARWLRPLAALLGRAAMRQIDRVLRRVDEALAGRRALPGPPLRVDEGATRRALEKLGRDAPAEIVERLGRLVLGGRDEEVARLRPYALADAWGLPRRAVLEACLHAVRAGLLELAWDVVCPSCQTAVERLPALSALEQHRSCHLCEVEIALDVDEAVEATFSPAPAVRVLDAGGYCVGGPSRTPQVMAQALLPARGEALLQAPEATGPCRLFVRGGGFVPVEISPGAAAEITVDDQVTAALRLAPGGTLRVRSTHDDDRHAKLELAARASQAATLREVTALPEFRRDFSSEVLRADVSLRVSRVALLFTDLTASTRLYASIGDAAALGLVHDHFRLVIGILERHGGALVKTIGDAVMAAFADETDGLAACLEILAEFAAFRRTRRHGERTDIKLGLYAGQSYLVTANGVLDYFGQTVNVAARLQALAADGELVIEAALADAAIAAGRLAVGAVQQRWSATLKGVDAPIDVVRIAVRPPAG